MNYSVRREDPQGRRLRKRQGFERNLEHEPQKRKYSSFSGIVRNI